MTNRALPLRRMQASQIRNAMISVFFGLLNQNVFVHSDVGNLNNSKYVVSHPELFREVCTEDT